MVELEAVCKPCSSRCSGGLRQTTSASHLMSSLHVNVMEISALPFFHTQNPSRTAPRLPSHSILLNRNAQGAWEAAMVEVRTLGARFNLLQTPIHSHHLQQRRPPLLHATHHVIAPCFYSCAHQPPAAATPCPPLPPSTTTCNSDAGCPRGEVQRLGSVRGTYPDVGSSLQGQGVDSNGQGSRYTAAALC